MIAQTPLKTAPACPYCGGAMLRRRVPASRALETALVTTAMAAFLLMLASGWFILLALAAIGGGLANRRTVLQCGGCRFQSPAG